VKPVRNRVADRQTIRNNREKNVVVDGVESGTEVKKDENKYFAAVDGADIVVMDRQHSSFRSVERPVSRLFKREQIVGRGVVSETLGDNTFDDFRDEGQVRDWTI
jgi:hypothetical protein